MEWDRLVSCHPAANTFHTSSWSNVLQATYRHRPHYLQFSNRGSLVALLPLMEVDSLFRKKRAISLPFSDLCQPLIFDHAFAPAVFEHVTRIAKERDWSYVEFRGGGLVPDSARPAVEFHQHELDLRGGPEEVLAAARGSVRQAIRKAGRSDVTVEVSRSGEAMQTFFDLHVTTRKRHGLPPQPFAFFSHIQKEIIERDMGFIVLASFQKQPVSAIVFFSWGKTAFYKFGASDKRFQDLRPNNLAMWEGIRTACLGGCERLHFGRSSLGNEGLRRFKLSWGAVESPLAYYRYDPASGQWGSTMDRTEGLYTHIFRRTPQAFNRLAGRLLYSHLD